MARSRRPKPLSSLAVLCLCCMVAMVIGYAVGESRTAPAVDDEASIMDVKDKLTVHQTIGLCFYHPHDGNIWHLLKRADPHARPALYHILQSEELGYRQHARAFDILGYVGDATDARKLRKVLIEFSGVLTAREQSVVVAVLRALGVMSRRGVTEATEILDDMTSLEYWRQSEIKWFSEKRSPHRELTPELEILSVVMISQGIAERDNLNEIREEILGAIEDPEMLKVMAYRVTETTNEYATYIREMENQSPTAKERSTLESLLRTYARHLEGVVDIEPEAAEVTTEQPAEEEWWSSEHVPQLEELIRKGDASVLKVLRRWLNELPEGPAGPDGRLLIAIHGVGLFQDRTALDKLRDLYQSESANPLVRDFAAEAIARMASEEELELLKEIMWNQRLTVSPRCEAAAALVRLDQEGGREFLLLQYDLYRLEAKTRSVRNMGFARSVLATMSDEKILAALEARLADEDDERMNRNIITLRQQMLINAKPLETLMLLAADPDWGESYRRTRAIDALGRKGGPELIPFLELLAPWEGENVPAGRDELLRRKIEETIGKIRQRH